MHVHAGARMLAPDPRRMRRRYYYRVVLPWTAVAFVSGLLLGTGWLGGGRRVGCRRWRLWVIGAGTDYQKSYNF
jgi:hypothetical protein